jgi:hypothetical protein
MRLDFSASEEFVSISHDDPLCPSRLPVHTLLTLGR